MWLPSLTQEQADSPPSAASSANRTSAAANPNAARRLAQSTGLLPMAARSFCDGAAAAAPPKLSLWALLSAPPAALLLGLGGLAPFVALTPPVAAMLPLPVRVGSEREREREYLLERNPSRYTDEKVANRLL